MVWLLSNKTPPTLLYTESVSYTHLDVYKRQVEGFPDTFKMVFRSVYGRIASGAKGASLHATAEDGHQEVAVCEAIMKSNERNAWVDVS